MERVSSPLRRHVLVIAVYLVLALILTYPLVLRSHTNVPGDGIDDPALAWNLWWVKFSLVDQISNPFDCDWMFYPVGINLAFYTLTILNGLLSVPLQGAIGLVASSNVLLYSSFVLGAYGAFLLAEYVRGSIGKNLAQNSSDRADTRSVWWSILPSVIAGAIYGFSSSKLFYVSLGQFNIASSQWIPFAVLYMLRMGRGRRLKDALLAALFLALQAYAELTFATFLVLLLGLLLLCRLVEHGAKQARSKRVRNQASGGLGEPSIWLLTRDVAVVGALVLLALAPFLLNMLPDLLSQGDLLTRGGGFEDVFSADLLGYLVPTMHHPLLGDAVTSLPFAKDKGQHVFLGYGVMVLAGIGAWRSRGSWQGRFWSACAVVFFALTLGPSIRVGGADTRLPGLFPLVSRLPLFEGNRYPSRYSVMLVLSSALLAAAGADQIGHWLTKRAAFPRSSQQSKRTSLLSMTAMVAVLIIVVFEHLSLPMPLSDMRVPSEYEAISTTAGTKTILDLPLGWRNGARVLGQQDEKIMFVQWYQTSHEQRLLGGNTSRNPEFKFQYFAAAPVINSIIALENEKELPQSTLVQDALNAAEVLGYFGVSHVAIHQPPVSQVVLDYVEDVLPVRELAAGESMRLYALEAPSVVDTTVQPASDLGRLRLGEGWSPLADTLDARPVVWAQQESSRLLPRLSGEETALLLDYWSPGSDQAVSVSVNGTRSNWHQLASGWNQVRLDMPEASLAIGINDLSLRFETMYDLSSVDQITSSAPCTIPSTANISSMVVQSAGMDSGGSDLGHIHVNGVDLSPNRRGYNVVALGPGGDVVLQAVYDTHLDPMASGRMDRDLKQLAAGTLVGVAAADEASMNLSEEAVLALAGIGATGDARGMFRAGHAIIGEVGASPGSALEVMGDLRPLAVHCGIAATRPSVAIALAQFSFE